MTEQRADLRDEDWKHHSDVWHQVLGAVEFLAQYHRPGLSVWEAVEEAGRWWIADRLNPPEDHGAPVATGLPWDDPDPLRTVLDGLLASVPSVGLPGGVTVSDTLSAALNVWLGYMSNTYNDGAAFARSTPPAGWPSVRRIDLP
ncbi:MAG TPA: hypothetical protein PK020_04150 [Ilumatobacteraceae bacterium]|nr:hypothetical protein [Ilumatobacteraceae bacterium]